jgi:hypothetical protein
MYIYIYWQKKKREKKKGIEENFKRIYIYLVMH